MVGQNCPKYEWWLWRLCSYSKQSETLYISILVGMRFTEVSGGNSTLPAALHRSGVYELELNFILAVYDENF